MKVRGRGETSPGAGASADSGSPPARGRVLDVIPPVFPELSYPIEDDGQDASAFIKCAAAVLSDPTTLIYVDTSFLMWLTKGGRESRAQFLTWADALGDRVHVPVWTYHEYYRHHTRNTMRSALAVEATKLLDAASRYATLAKDYADDPFKAGFTVDAFDRQLEQMVKIVRDVTDTGKAWDYIGATKQISEWMSRRLCRSKVVFDLMDRLGDVGPTRYTQDVPPGFRDRTKKDSPKLGSNKFGDLILWEEVLAHLAKARAKNVVVLTRDRKEDWFAPSGVPKIGTELRNMRASQKWNPVPAPHPTLVIELRERTTAQDLTLLDSLYFGAALHELGRSDLERLIAYSLDIRSTAYVDFVNSLAREGKEAPKRPEGEPLSKGRARRLLDAMTSPLPQTPIGAAVMKIRDAVRGDVASADQFVDAFDEKALTALDIDDAALLGRVACADAQSAGGQISTKLCVRLLDELLPRVKAGIAGAVYAGMVHASYYEDEGNLKATPSSPVLQKLFSQMEVPTYKNVLGVFAERLPTDEGRPLFVPAADASSLEIILTTDSLQEQVPAVLKEIAFGGKTLTRTSGPGMPGNLRGLLQAKEVVSVEGLLELVATQYGLPRHLLIANVADLAEERTIPASLCFAAPEDLSSLTEAIDTPEDDVLNQIDEAGLAPLDEDLLDESPLLEDECDD